MKAIEFEGQTLILRPPDGWDNTGDGLKCGGLPVLITEQQGHPLMLSFWKPSAEDIEALKNGAYVRLGIVGGSHPPVVVDIGQCVDLP